VAGSLRHAGAQATEVTDEKPVRLIAVVAVVAVAQNCRRMHGGQARVSPVTT